MTTSSRLGPELRRLLTIAAPLTAAYLAEYLMFVTTKLVVGELGFLELAAIGLAGSMTWEILVVAMGILSITGVLAAQAEGAEDAATAGHAARQGVIVALVLSVPLTLLVWRLDVVLGWAGQEPEVLALVKPYVATLAPIAPAVLIFAVLRNFIAALAKTRAIMVITVAAVGLNWALTEGLVFGRWGLPELGLAGAGLATSVVNWLMLIALVAHVWRTPALRGYGLFRARLRVDIAIIGEFFRLGFPVAGLVAVEAGLFTAVGLLSGVIGSETLAAHQVLMGWIGFPFMIALALAEATMVRVAFNVGRRDPGAARYSGLTGMGTGVAVLLALSFVPVLMAEEITRIFIPADDPGFAEVSAIAARLMLLAAVFQVFDGLQVIAARSLRGVKDAFAPLWIGAVGYWVLGVGPGYVFAFPLGMGGEGLWIGLAIGIVAAALMLTARFLALTVRMMRP